MSFQPRTLAVLGGVLAIAAGTGTVISGVGGQDGYVVRAEFADAGGARKNSDVKVGEVPAGRVTRVDLTDRDTAMVTMHLDDGVGPIGRGARARSRPVNLLGEKYIDLDIGDSRHPLPSGTTIPQGRTSTAVELDDVLNVLEPDTRAALRVLINEAGIALAGRGTQFNRLLAELPSGLDEATRFLDGMSRDTRRLEQLVVQGDRVLAPIAGKRRDLADLVENADATLATVARQRAELGRTLQRAPAGLRELRATLGQLERAGHALRPAAANLRTATAPLADTLRRLPAFANDARQTLREVARVAPALGRLGRQGTPTARLLRPTLDRLAEFGAGMGPTIETLDDGAMKELLRFTNNWANLTQRQDGIGHVFRVRLVVAKDFFAPGSKVTTSLRKRPARRKRTGPRRTQETPGSPDRPRPPLHQPALKDLPKVIERLPEKVQGLLNGVLGQPQETNPPPKQGTTALLDYLLGP